ncbi:hypothetical protein GU926_00345 [Nibribacter ruber]|uniref:Uncharacterized protein n=1 Tax=Nibribacter ruber TaxID=2698458 RepID=A0A6P1NYK2_9BACT|nr:hypothetical protein [Nibribacter ruber]QHL85973.1 hypothetical protein GU926_00345 [Nibribacter ruber]
MFIVSIGVKPLLNHDIKFSELYRSENEEGIAKFISSLKKHEGPIPVESLNSLVGYPIRVNEVYYCDIEVYIILTKE